MFVIKLHTKFVVLGYTVLNQLESYLIYKKMYFPELAIRVKQVFFEKNLFDSDGASPPRQGLGMVRYQEHICRSHKYVIGDFEKNSYKSFLKFLPTLTSITTLRYSNLN